VLVTTGPLTNLAAAIADEPELIGSYRRIVVMGGAFHVPGNTGPVAEFNVYVDPEAARAVLGSGGNITLVPLDATTRAPLMRSTLESYAAFRERPEPGSPPRLSAILARALDFYMRYQFRESGLDGGFMHDPLAVAAAFAPEILTTSRALVDVGVGQEDRGCTSLRPPSADSAVDVAFDLNEEAFERLLVERVLEPVFVG
jgi:inosine-uridine nucleoside N-ribohydrolase